MLKHKRLTTGPHLSVSPINYSITDFISKLVQCRPSSTQTMNSKVMATPHKGNEYYRDLEKQANSIVGHLEKVPKLT